MHPAADLLVHRRNRALLGISLLILLAWMTGPTSGVYAIGDAATNDEAVHLPLIATGERPESDALPVIHSFTADPPTVAAGAASTLRWQVTGATSLNILPTLGAVSGDSVAVNPAITTEYTLIAGNDAGFVTAKTTVSVQVLEPQGGIFIPGLPQIERPTSHPTLQVDGAGGVHLTFTADIPTPETGTRPVFYGYCPANCIHADAFTLVALGDGIEYANLALTPDGSPRILVRGRTGDPDLFVYTYWTCDSDCTQAAQWNSAAVGDAHPRPVGWVEPHSRYFALDHLGRPRFVYYDDGATPEDPDWGAFYTYCDSDCTNAANWAESRIVEDRFATGFALAFSPTGQPRLAFTSFRPDSWYIAYAECNSNCASPIAWSGRHLVNTVSTDVSEFATFALRVTSSGKPRLALYTGTGSGGTLPPRTLHYLWCNAESCTHNLNVIWFASTLKVPTNHGEAGIDLALDSQDRPRIVYHAPLAAGDGLYYAWCSANCEVEETDATTWQYEQVESSEKVEQELPIPPWPGCSFPQCDPPIPACTLSAWDNGLRPSLALDAAGNPRIAYDAEHGQGGACGAFIDTRLTRFTLFDQP